MRKLTEQQELYSLRRSREVQCFKIINRGRLWYSCLTDEQLAELTDWYFAWLDVTETREIPVAPAWLKEKLKREERIW